MAWTTIDDLRSSVPLDLFDANGMVIHRAVIAFDPETGKVKSLVLDEQGRETVDDVNGCLLTRVETFPAPLAWMSISRQMAVASRLLYWDLQGR